MKAYLTALGFHITSRPLSISHPHMKWEDFETQLIDFSKELREESNKKTLSISSNASTVNPSRKKPGTPPSTGTKSMGTESTVPSVVVIKKNSTLVKKLLSRKSSMASSMTSSISSTMTSTTPRVHPFQVKIPFTYKLKSIHSQRKNIQERCLRQDFRKDLPSDLYKTRSSSSRPRTPWDKITHTDIIGDLFDLYDHYIFGDWLHYHLHDQSHTIMFNLNQNVNTAGCVSTSIHPIKLSLSVYHINRLTPENIDQTEVGKCNVTDRLDYICRVMEHELIHLAIMISPDLTDVEKYDRSHGPLFQTMIEQLFGHKCCSAKSKPSSKLLSSVDDIKKSLLLNSTVYFKNGKVKDSGTLIKINPKRAKIKTDKGLMSVPYELLLL